MAGGKNTLRSSWHGGVIAACGHPQCNGVCVVRKGRGGRRGEDHTDVRHVGGTGGGGGGGVVPNLRVVLTAWPPADDAALVALNTRETCDLSDRAHNVHEPGNFFPMLVPGAKVAKNGAGGGGRARRYPRHQLTSRGVAFDSAYDELHGRQSALAREGASDLGAHTGRAGGGDWKSRMIGAGYLAARGLSVRAVVDRNRAAWDCGPMPTW